MNSHPRIDLGIIGGSGLYDIDGLSDIIEKEIQTPFGKPSSPITIGRIGSVSIGFIARHGTGHTITPTEVNYRANIFAMKLLGVKKIVGISACGSLREDYQPGILVVPSQLFDFTKNRKRSFFEEGFVTHIGVAEPFCSDFSNDIYSAVKKVSPTAKHGGTAITIEGPRFSTKAESQIYRGWGLDLIGMTTAPEAFLAREAEICYGSIFHVTDYDVWHQTEDPVSVDQIFQVIKKNTRLAKESIFVLANDFKISQSCECENALEHAFTTAKSAIQDDIYNKLKILVEKYDLQS